MVRSLVVGVETLIANHMFDSQVRGDERGHYTDTSVGDDRAVDYQVWVRNMMTLELHHQVLTSPDSFHNVWEFWYVAYFYGGTID